MLKRTDDEFYGYGVESKTSEKLIEEIDKRVINKEKQFEDVKYELELIKKARFDIYKSNVYYIISECLPSAHHWSGAIKKGMLNGEKIDNRKNYKEKSSFLFVQQRTSEYLGVVIDVKEIVDYNFSEAYEVIFDYLGCTRMVTYPMVKNIKIKSLEDYGSNVFRIKLHIKEGNYSWKYVGSTFNEEDLKEIFQEGINKYVKTENK